MEHEPSAAHYRYTRTLIRFCLPKGCVLILALLIARHVSLAEQDTNASPSIASPTISEAANGPGLHRGGQELSLATGPGFGMKVLGSRQHHDWVLGSVQYGWMVSDVVGENHWYRGNFEFVGQLFGGEQYHPDNAYVIGITPIARYNFAVSPRIIPFFDLGAGVSATDIRNGDLSTTFEFNLQAAAGVRFFINDNLALTFQYRFIHLSNDNIDSPNLGANTSNLWLGATWLF